jgi:hypothetical protein
VAVSSSVVTNAHVPPEVVESASGQNNVSVVGLLVSADPCSDHSPECLKGWVGTDS